MKNVKDGRTSAKIVCCLVVIVAMGLQAGAGFTHEAMAPDMWMAPEHMAHLENPIAAEADSITRGKEIFLQNCSACHGENGEGLDAKTIGLETNPPNLKERIKMHPDGDFFWKIQAGRGEMPSFEKELTNEEIWDVINYIKKQSD